MIVDHTDTTIGAVLDQDGGSVQTGPFGTKLKASEYTEDGVPVISVGEVQYGRLKVHAKTPRVNEAVTTRMPEYLLREGDIVFGRKGAVDRSAIVRADQDGWFLGSDGIRLRLPDSCDRNFIAYQLLHPKHREWMFQHAAGSTMPSLNEGIVRRIPITLPPLSEQRAIASVLGSLDDKIELNRQMNRTLEQMAAVIFKAWFVDFQPDMTPRRVGDLASENILLIGDGYRAKRSELDIEGVPFIRAGNVNGRVESQCAERLSMASVMKAGVKRSCVWDTVMTTKGTVGRIALVTPGSGDVVYAPQVCFWRCLDQSALDPFVLHCWLRSREFMLQVEAVKGQTDMADFVSLGDQRNMVIPLATPTCQKLIIPALRPLFELMDSLDIESRTLAAIRDTLLPELLSGRAQIKSDVAIGAGS